MAISLCEGTPAPLRLALGVMSRPTNVWQREAVRSTWGSADAKVLACFLVGGLVKRTPRTPWDKRHADELLEPGGGPRGELSFSTHNTTLHHEHARFGDVLVLPDSAEIHQVSCARSLRNRATT